MDLKGDIGIKKYFGYMKITWLNGYVENSRILPNWLTTIIKFFKWRADEQCSKYVAKWQNWTKLVQNRNYPPVRPNVSCYMWFDSS